MGRSQTRPVEVLARPTHLTNRPQAVRILFASASPKLIAETLVRMSSVSPELPLVVVSEFAVEEGEWIPYHLPRTREENRELILARLAGREIRTGAIILDPTVPHEALRELGKSMLGSRALVFDEAGSTGTLRHSIRQGQRATFFCPLCQKP